MVNTLWNTPEKVTTTANRSWSSMLKKIVAWAIALTLSGQPAEVKAYNKQEFPTEMVANIPWIFSYDWKCRTSNSYLIILIKQKIE